MRAVDDRTFEVVLKEPLGLMLSALARSSSVPLFIVPKAVAETPVGQQTSDVTGSGPFVFKKDEWKPGEKTVYVRNPDYRPRQEPPSGLAGGKVARLDRIEWVSIPDSQTAISALQKGEIDMIEQPAHDLLPEIEKDKNIEIIVPDKLGPPFCASTGSCRRSTTCAPPRRRICHQPARLLKAVIGDPRFSRPARRCSAAARRSRTAPAWMHLESDFAESKKILKEAGYDGTRSCYCTDRSRH